MKKLSPDKWNRKCAAHLLLRTGFGATPKQLEAILKQVKPQTSFPNSRFTKELQLVSQLITGHMPSRIFYLSRGGFDTHTKQLGSHATLMKEVGDALQVFMAEMNAAGQAGLIRGDIAHTTDYRSIYATLIEKHLGVDSKPVLQGTFEPLEFI